MANRLANETSPYLLQHAHNPVDWYPWGEEAFEKAMTEDKPVLVSIGYAACHWCHVMEKESFESTPVAAIMNERFVNIKVDREERPDVDHIYMDAVQAITGSGGWPLNVFLTPHKKAFYGGTYFPPKRAFNRASWTEVLLAISDAYGTRRDEILQQAESLMQHIEASNSFGVDLANAAFDKQMIATAFENLMKTADKEWGGFGNAPKFPQTFSINFLLSYAYLEKDKDALTQAITSLTKMIQGGIYDHVGGGFARYSTDREWLVPHFEKMLYDNALIVSTLADAYSLTKDELYKDVMEQSLAFVERELQHAGGGFFSALDADSEGEEGKFYVWSYDEVKAALGEDAELFCDFYDITPQGNWEGKNIPWVMVPVREFAQTHSLGKTELTNFLAECRSKLLVKRSMRVRPQLDDKVLLGWNALMNIAFIKAYNSTGNEHYRNVAEKNIQFLLSAFPSQMPVLHHTWKNNEAKYPAFLDDYALFISALIHLAQSTANFSYLTIAEKLTDAVLDGFSDDASPLFYYTHKNQNDIPVRKKEIYDGATPSGNAVMAANLYRLSILLDNREWRVKAEKMVENLAGIIVKYPTSFGGWLSTLYEMVSGTKEIAIIGDQSKNFLKQINALYLPHSVIMASEAGDDRFPLIAQKPQNSKSNIYLCQNYSCQRPVFTVADFVKLLDLK